MFRHWDTWKDGRRAHLFAWKLAGGPVVNLQKKQNADSPSKPFGGSEDFTVSESGTEQPITQFARDRVPLNLAFILDVSDSMRGPRMDEAGCDPSSPSWRREAIAG